jgi:hypothetical protein
MKSEVFLTGISWAASEVKRRRRISLDEAAGHLLDTMNIREVSERILLVEEVKKRVSRHELIRNIISGMTEMASGLYRESKTSIPAAVDETEKKYELLLKFNNFDSPEWSKFFRQRVCRRLAYRSNAVRRAKKAKMAHPKRKPE